MGYNDLENGMVVGAQEEYDRMYADTPWDNRDEDTLTEYVGDKGLEADILAEYLDAIPGGVEPDSVATLYWHLDRKFRYEITETYMELNHLESDYDEWWRELNSGWEE